MLSLMGQTTVLEYACPAWHSSSSNHQTKLLEDIQRRALQITVGNTSNAEACCLLDIQSLFKQTADNELYSLHYPMTAKRDTQLISRLWSTTVYPTFCVWTNRFKNLFLPYRLSISDSHDILLLIVCMTVFVRLS